MRVLIAGALGALIGYQRQQEHKPAQLRDHALVSIGSCLFMLVSISFDEGDASRIASNVVTGIGFLGAGVIIRHEREGVVRGLTTAASIWTVAAIGLAVGVGLYVLAVASTVGVFLLLRMWHDVLPDEAA
jgi:putative Mg2+ transporter-C (MgtC) family protein